MGDTKITIGELVNDASLLAKVYSVQPEVIELLAKCAITYLNRKEYPEADKVIEAMQTLAPRHPEVLYLFGMRQLEQRNIPDADEALSQLLNSVRAKEATTIRPREGCISLLAMAASLSMYPAKEAGKHDLVHELFQEIYLEYSSDRGALTQDQRDLDHIARCLARMDAILSQTEIEPAFAETLMVDLRKLLQEKTKRAQPLLSKRCGLRILLPSVVGHDPATELNRAGFAGG